ncbi:restriction endonuclease subunit S [Sulfurihydrogenibium yellowstonense]|uniref:Type I restriction-modification system specificity subunit n=1 Tax=Sulfurihydrogenibium yellowstonense SS-5 TaxID=432331 RepID=C4FKE1_9AQUI|nr:restriction endonuclease subunit S [Sulfurihydrogenibium yellowstonense]EEP60453.1 type I restriction-modification system specificity subunit [Sulfurihydrogenibium yellowstonense SS-5]
MKESKGFKETEIGLIPEDWEVARLGEVFEVKQGKQLSAKENRDGKVLKPFLRTSNVLWNKIDLSELSYMPFSESEFKNLKLKKGDILVCEGGDVGRTAVWDGQIDEISYQNHLHRLRSVKDSINNYFFAYWMEYAITIKNLYHQNANKTTIPNLSSSRLKAFPIPLPPLEEQKAIADILSTVQNAIEKTEKVINATKQLKKSMMKHLFTYGAVAVDEIDKVKLKESEIGLTPEHWEVVRLGEVVEKMKAGGTPKRSEKRFWGGSIPFILIEDLTKNNLYIEDAREYITEEGLENSNAWIVPENSLLLSMYATIGKTAVNLIPVATNQAILGIIPKRDRLNVEFGAYLLKFHSKRLLSQNIQTTQRNVNKGIVENFLIPLPPLDEQQKIANILTTIDQKIQAEEKKKVALRSLFKTLLHQLMTGKIRVR